MSLESQISYRTFVLIILSAIIIGFGGYWYGSRNPGGFALGPSPVNDILQVDQGPARDHPGSVSMNVNSGLQQYENNYIGLYFQFPTGWTVSDGWAGDATDLSVSGNTLLKASQNFKSEAPQVSQFEIIYSSRLIDDFQFGVKNLDEYVEVYSKEVTQPTGEVVPAKFNNPEKVTIGNQEGYKVEKDGNKLCLVNTNKGFYQIIFRPDQDVTEDMINTIVSNLKFN